MKTNSGAQCGCEMGYDCSKITVCTGEAWMVEAKQEVDLQWLRALENILDADLLDKIHRQVSADR